MESHVAILTNSNDEPPGNAAAEPANLPNPCQIPRIISFSGGYKRKLEGPMPEFLDQRVIGLMRPA
ncbi:uncharacterized protein N7487_002385 [Penicillium crustosum]|uniref:uncharacterized protein n=1 Tax=Penicillium crustosum TaxID=36656 RepID=UPI00238D7BC6|nr:uncharacterized protein N7487_002385 [Penicillium crustosum]KAJ5418835.1 hypothetical protein N7487_002385 [Penicillium crustosum]